MTHSGFTHSLAELTGITSARLADEASLSAVTIAAASAVGLSAYGPPTVHSGPGGVAIGLLCRAGHIVLHSLPDDGVCLVDIVVRSPGSAQRGVDVITRRLGGTATPIQ
ncbi:MAG: S-adenosylmethionine decarboxylase [Gemmatimonadota bacterium]